MSRRNSLIVIPAKAGIYSSAQALATGFLTSKGTEEWVPAFAGKTHQER